jgi:tetratricopeptide (TPR) repeat protein
VEAIRTPDELESIRDKGRAFSRSHKRVFRGIISNQAGWDTWLLTFTRDIALHHFATQIIEAESALENGQLSEARDIAEQIITERPYHSLGYHLRARVALEEFRHADAIHDLTTCIPFNPRNVEFYLLRAKSHLALGDLRAANADLKKASKLAPNDERLRVLRDIAAKRQAQLHAE